MAFNYNNMGSFTNSGGQSMGFRSASSRGGTGKSRSRGGSGRRYFKIGKNANTSLTGRGKRKGFQSGFFRMPSRGKNAYGFLNKYGQLAQVADANKLKRLRRGMIDTIENPFRQNLLSLNEQRKKTEKWQPDIPTAESTLEYQDAINDLRLQYAGQRMPLQSELARISAPGYFASQLGRLRANIGQQADVAENQFADAGMFFSGARDAASREAQMAADEEMLNLRRTEGDIARQNLMEQLEFLRTQQRAQETAIANAINRQLAMGMGDIF